MHLHREKAVADAEFYRVRALAFAAAGHTPRTSVLSPHDPHPAPYDVVCVWTGCRLAGGRVGCGRGVRVAQATKEAEANSELLTESYLELQQIMAMGNTSKVYFGPQLPSFVLAGTGSGSSGRGQ